MTTDNNGGKWWDEVKLPSADGHFHQGWANLGLAIQALKGGPPVRIRHLNASLGENVSPQDWVRALQVKFPGLRVIEETLGTRRSSDSEWVLVDTRSSLRISYDGDRKLDATVVASDDAFLGAFLEHWVLNTSRAMPKGRVHVLVAAKEGPEFKSMGIGGEALVRDNYTDEVLRGYDRVVRDLGSSNPGGRVAILDGPPGSGKTFLVRGILDEVRDAVMVIVPANLVVQLAQPGMIPALVQLHKGNGGRPMVFIIEDADECLAPRMGDNMSAVSTVLNLGDGILGKLLDVRILATTNARRQELDEAIMRPGRLSASVTVGPLPMDRAREVFERLAPGKKLDHKRDGYTLAEIYQQARDEGWSPPKLDKNKMGFAPMHDDDDDDDDFMPVPLPGFSDD